MSSLVKISEPNRGESEVTINLTDRNADFLSKFETHGFASLEELLNTAIRQLRNAEKLQKMAKTRETAYSSLKTDEQDFVWEPVDGEPFADS